jgi:hypothetical protein
MKPRSAMMGFAGAILLGFAAAPAHAAPPPFTVKCVETKNTNVSLTGTDGSQCFASSDKTGTAKAKASDAGSFADAELSSHGTSTATARGGSFSGAFSDNKSTSISHVTGPGGDGDATSDHKGTATTNALGGAEAHTQAFGNCDAKANATGTGSFALADCEANGTFAHATSTGGGEARGFWNGPPICNPNGGTAKVRSTGGNCGP